MYLVFPNSVAFDGQPAHGDWSMTAMQLPVVLLPFAALVRRRDLFDLAPALALGLIATVMALDTFAPLAALVRQALPVLGYSRFPAGDYRFFLYLAVLLACLAGLRRAMLQWPWPPAVLARVAAGSLVLLGLALALRLCGACPRPTGCGSSGSGLGRPRGWAA